MTDAWRLTTLAVLASILFCADARAELSESGRLAAIYDTILDGRFESAAAELKQACPPAPPEACQALAVVSMWWQISINPDDRRLDASFNRSAAAAIAAADDWTQREPHSGEAWFYLAGSYVPLAQWRVLRGERLAAARDGNRIKEALERALQLDPSLTDAFVGIGLYHYYAAVAPLTARFLRWLLLLPGGDRAEGLAEVLRTYERGELLKGEAAYQLALIYLWYEQKPREGLNLLESLVQRYPGNPLFAQRVAEVEDEYFHDPLASAAAWQRLLDRARNARVAEAATAETRARLGLATQLDAVHETDRAIDQLIVVREARPSQPPDARARAELQLGMAYDRLGHRELALAAYNAVLQLVPSTDVKGLRTRALTGLRRSPDPRLTTAYREELDGWRAFAAGDLAQADRLLASAVARMRDDPVARYRYARVLEANGDSVRAQAELEHVTATRPAPPAFVLASAYLARARLVERAGDRVRARDLYRTASDIAGGDPEARHEARRALARLDELK